MSTPGVQRIAVIGSGIAGAACAHALARAGHAVHIFDKARGPGGRLATRRMAWVHADGQSDMTRLDHGCLGIAAQSAAFQAFVAQAVRAGWLAEWTPELAPGSVPLELGGSLHVPVPDMPELCRRLLQGVAATFSCAVDRLHRNPFGWQVEAAGQRQGAAFDAVVLALPPAQAAPLLGPHRSDWARYAALAPMQPCWTLMGVASTAETGAAPGWRLARPPGGPLAWVLRSDARPGRAQVPGQAHWAAHARPGWSRQHLERPPAWVQQQLQAALANVVERPVDWLQATVHRWRYALPQARRSQAGDSFWWDAGQGLGVCGDFLGGSGVEGAWTSGQSLSAALLGDLGAAPPSPSGLPAVQQLHRPQEASL